MAVLGIICEYDPFHNGHLLHMRSAKESCGADATVCVMSCAFTQRGEPALFSARTRARMALACGADVVLGLPYAFSAREAENFALGGISILKSISETTHVAFGCEETDQSILIRAADTLECPTETYQSILREQLSLGLPFAAAQGAALEEIENIPKSTLSQPNNALAVCYLRALTRTNASIAPIFIPRIGDHRSEATGEIASATAVRAAILRGDWYHAKRAMPEAAYDIARETIARGEIHRPGALDGALLAFLLRACPEDLRDLPEFSEGLEHRVLRAARSCATRQQLLETVKTRRYTRARISRALCHALVDASAADFSGTPTYARLLGFRKTALPLLSRMAKGGFPLVSKPSGDARLALDMRAESLWALGAGMPPDTYYRQKMLILS